MYLLTIDTSFEANPSQDYKEFTGENIVGSIWDDTLKEYKRLGCDITIAFYGFTVIEAWVIRNGNPIASVMLSH